MNVKMFGNWTQNWWILMSKWRQGSTHCPSKPQPPSPYPPSSHFSRQEENRKKKILKGKKEKSKKKDGKGTHVYRQKYGNWWQNRRFCRKYFGKLGLVKVFKSIEQYTFMFLS